MEQKAWQTNSNHFALVVGINDYSRYNHLQGPIADAEDFVKWLCDEKDGGGLPDNNCRPILCVSKPGDPEAIQDRIDDEFEALMRQVKSSTPAQRLYVYFSGHGIAPARLATGMCASNWDESWGKDRALNSQQYLEALLQSGKFLEVVMLLDCCRVRLVSAKGRGPAGWPVDPQNAQNCKQFQADAAEFTNKAFEVAVETPGAPAPVVRGYFTRALLEALRGAAAISSGGVPAGNLKKYLEKRVPDLALVDGYVQKPEIVNGLPADPEPIFGTAKPTGTPPSGRGGGGAPTSPASPRGPLLPPDFVRIPGGISLGTRLFRTVLDSESASKRRTRKPPRQIQLRGPEARALIKSFSATPLATNFATGGQYVVASSRWSRVSTRPLLGKASKASLFIFVRAVSPSKYKEGAGLFDGMELINSSGKVVSAFAPREIKSDLSQGWAALNARAPQGTYILRFKGSPNRDVPICLFAGWQTQVFLMFHGAPLFETMKIFVERPGFRPQDREMRICDLALNGLQNHQDLLDERDLNVLLYGKFHNPMLGLVGAHILFQKPELSPRIEIVLRNLDRLLPESADVAALVRLAQLKGMPIRLHKKEIEFNEPPMLRMSLEIIVEASAVTPAAIQPDSPIPIVVTRLYADSPWTSWETIQPGTRGFHPNWVHVALLDEVRTRARRMDTNVEAFNISVFARQIGVTPQTVRTAIADLDKAETNDLATAFPDEFPMELGSSRATGGSRWFSALLRRNVSNTKGTRKVEFSGNDYAQA
jgi:hypothetical protein